MSLVLSVKTCRCCGEQKSPDHFYSYKRNRDGLKHECKTCCAADSARRYKEDIERFRARSAQQYRRNPDRLKANPEAARKRAAEWRKKNAERAKAAKAAYARENAAKLNADVAIRKAMKLQATPSWADRAAIKRMYAEASRMSEGGVIHHVDHIVPLRSHLVCGLHCEANLQILQGKENNSKGNRYWPDMP